MRRSGGEEKGSLKGQARKLYGHAGKMDLELELSMGKKRSRVLKAIFFPCPSSYTGLEIFPGLRSEKK